MRPTPAAGSASVPQADKPISAQWTVAAQGRAHRPFGFHPAPPRVRLFCPRQAGLRLSERCLSYRVLLACRRSAGALARLACFSCVSNEANMKTHPSRKENSKDWTDLEFDYGILPAPCTSVSVSKRDMNGTIATRRGNPAARAAHSRFLPRLSESLRTFLTNQRNEPNFCPKSS